MARFFPRQDPSLNLAAGKPHDGPKGDRSSISHPAPRVRSSVGDSVSPAHPCTHPGLKLLSTPLTKGPSKSSPLGLGRPDTL